ncbi:DUF4386 domain-containing protein [Herpetosiphon giganteus]|uniref:DUF4386 domain-containing protein n=1 Tax=Herpetosiphon giganteus TaxID=2029754 RepID=UPI0019587050|nr:DUF4386 domain-containing protein [Herpetosiphon giganteus]MBM7845456.1 hypothetical protein [Herpetosiphon giganteus]
MANSSPHYQIQIKGQLDPGWAEWFDDLAISHTPQGDTLLTGPIVDQAALYRVLRKIRDSGLSLIAVVPLEQPISISQGASTMANQRRHAILIGIFFILAAVSSILGLLWYAPLLTESDYLRTGAANANQIVFAALMELVLVTTAVGTAVTMFPILRQYSERIALAHLCFRFLEAVVITIGIVGMLALLSISREFSNAAAADEQSYRVVGTALIAIHDWTFMLGPNFMLGLNTIMYSYIFFQTRQIPRPIATLGLVGSSLIFLASLLEMFGIIEQLSTWGALLAIPVALTEMSLAIWLITKGFKPNANAAKTNSSQQLVNSSPI